MKTLSYVLRSVVTLLLVCSATASSAQWWNPCPPGKSNPPPPSNSGTEFLLCYMQNELPLAEDLDTYQDLYVASLGESAIVTITCKEYPTFVRIDTLSPYTSRTIRLNLHPGSVLIQSNEVVTQTVVKVISSAAVVCYGMNHKKFTADAFLALPKNVAQTDYMVMSYQNSALIENGSERPSEFSVAAFDDNTTVTITPTCPTASGSSAGTSLKFTLNAGEGVQIQAFGRDIRLDCTGSTVTSDKKIVVYGGHVRAEVPAGFTYPGGSNTSRNHLCEAMPPTSTWGKQFITRNFITPTNERDQGDILRVLALKNGTTFKINGVPSSAGALSSGKWFDTLIKGPVSIDASDQVLVGMFAHTASDQQAVGDPFFVIVPPVEQSYNDFTFFVSSDPVFTNNTYLIVVTENSGVGEIKLDNVKRPAFGYTPIPGSFGGNQWSMETIPISTGGIHRITTPNLKEKGITILSYGFGNVDGYGYTAGALLKPFNGIREIDGGKQLSGIAPGSSQRPQVGIRNILASKVWFDSAVFTHSAMEKYAVRTKRNIALDIQSFEGGETLTLDLDVFPPNTDEIITGTMKVYHHTTQWRDLQAVDVPFTIYPQSTARVDDAVVSPFKLSAYPNPTSNDRFTVNFTLPKRQMVSVRLIDATGRIVRVITSGALPAGENEFSVDTHDLAAGLYTCEIIAPEHVQNERRQIVVVK